MQSGDILTAKEAEYIEALEALLDYVSDALDTGAKEMPGQLVDFRDRCERLALEVEREANA